MKSSVTLKARAAPEGEGLYGIAVMAGNRGIHRISCVCCEFRAPWDFSNITLYPDRMFFYGSSQDFFPNVRGQNTAIARSEKLGLKSREQSEIPLLSLELSKEQLDLIAFLLPSVRESILNHSYMFDADKKRLLPSRRGRPYQIMQSIFLNYFPKRLLDLAIGADHYYEFKDDLSLKHVRI